MKKLLLILTAAAIIAIPAISGGQEMSCDVLVRATDGSTDYRTAIIQKSGNY